jgi:hypothetical protein
MGTQPGSREDEFDGERNAAEALKRWAFPPHFLILLAGKNFVCSATAGGINQPVVTC